LSALSPAQGKATDAAAALWACDRIICALICSASRLLSWLCVIRQQNFREGYMKSCVNTRATAIHRLFRFATRAVSLAAAATVGSAAVAGDAYPSKMVRIIVGFAPGGPADIAARIVAQGLQETLKQTVIVENRAGAGGNIATQHVAKAPKDGHTLLMTTASFALNVSTYANPGYDPEKDFTPVALVATQATGVAVHPSLAANTLAELQTLMKKEKMAFATPGVGTSSDLMGAQLFHMLWRADIVAVPYRGAGPVDSAVLAGEPPIGLTTIGKTNVTFHKRGRIKILAVSSDRRLTALPDVPTMTELGYRDFSPSWVGLLAPASTPPAAVKKLNAAINELLAKQDYKDKFELQLMVTAEPGTTSKQFADSYLKPDLQRLSRIVKATGVRAD
jgi:tripartite-type tricarboxylate transporter receptor subunit TctC